MSTVLIAASPSSSMPFVVLPVVRAFVARGHRVVLLAAEEVRSAAEELEAVFVPVPATPKTPPKPSALLPGLQQVDADIRDQVLRPLPVQWAVVQRVLQEHEVDVIVSDAFFPGAAMLGVVPADRRPPVIVLSSFPLPFADRDVPPFGLGLPPLDSALNRPRNVLLHQLINGVLLRRVGRDLDRSVHELTGEHLRGGVLAAPMVADVWAQLSVERFDYPRARMPGDVRYIGPLRQMNLGALPEWWGERDDRPIVHVCHEPGTDPKDLTVPAVLALADEPVRVVVTADCDVRAVQSLLHGRRPANVRVERRIPFAHLMPASSVMITQGDPTIVHYALRFGLPLVVAGTAEHQVETNARVAWSGAGVDLRAARPQAGAIRAAVRRALVDPAIAAASSRIAAQIAGTDAEAELCHIAEELIALRSEEALSA